MSKEPTGFQLFSTERGFFMNIVWAFAQAVPKTGLNRRISLVIRHMERRVLRIELEQTLSRSRSGSGWAGWAASELSPGSTNHPVTSIILLYLLFLFIWSWNSTVPFNWHNTSNRKESRHKRSLKEEKREATPEGISYKRREERDKADSEEESKPTRQEE